MHNVLAQPFPNHPLFAIPPPLLAERRGRRGGGEDGADEFIPSRADEVRDWGSTRKFQPSDDGPRGRGFGGGFGGRGDSRDGRPVSLADEAADWGGNKKFEPSTGLGGGFKDREGPRRGPMFEPSSKADEEEQWSRKGPLPVPETREKSRGRERSGALRRLLVGMHLRRPGQDQEMGRACL
eukprot:311159-Pelagomonas_calceolata.AAC.2